MIQALLYTNQVPYQHQRNTLGIIKSIQREHYEELEEICFWGEISSDKKFIKFGAVFHEHPNRKF